MKKILVAVLAMVLVNSSAYACTDFRIVAQDKSVVIARSMEFAEDMHSNVRTSNRDRSFQEVTPNGKPGISWKARYGYVFLDAFNVDVSLDGMNEAGLSIEALYLPGETQYQN